MPRSSLFHWWKVGVIALTVLLLGVAVVTRPPEETRTALVFAALVLVAAFLRIEMGDASIGFEAAVVFGAIVIFTSGGGAGVGTRGAGAHAAYRSAARRGGAKLAPRAVLQHRAAGAVLFSRRCCSIRWPWPRRQTGREDGRVHAAPGRLRRRHLLFVSVRRYFEEDAAPIDVGAFFS